MVIINHVEKIAQPKVIVTPVSPVKEEQAKEKAETKNSRKAKED